MLNKYYSPKHVYNYIYGTDQPDGQIEILYGTTADDVIYGGGGSDLLSGGAGNDWYYGGTGNDNYCVVDAGDTVVEYADEGNDTVFSWLHDYTLTANVENLDLMGDAFSGTGNGLNNMIAGNDKNNFLYGLDGNDHLYGGKGADAMYGGVGDDSYWVDNQADGVWELADQGHDTVYSTVSYKLNSAAEDLYLENGAGSINGTGNDLDNHIVGNEGNNILKGGDGEDTLDGKGGKDTMYGGADHDWYVVDNAGDVVVELKDEGYDTVCATINYMILPSNVERLVLSGSAVLGGGNELDNNIWGNDMDNHLYGFDGMDDIWGGDGADIITGGRGSDGLFGEAGNDTFRFQADFGADCIYDFKANGDADVIEFDHNLFADFAAVQAHMTEEFGHRVMITYDDNNKILIDNADIASLTAADFHFV